MSDDPDQPPLQLQIQSFTVPSKPNASETVEAVEIEISGGSSFVRRFLKRCRVLKEPERSAQRTDHATDKQQPNSNLPSATEQTFGTGGTTNCMANAGDNCGYNNCGNNDYAITEMTEPESSNNDTHNGAESPEEQLDEEIGTSSKPTADTSVDPKQQQQQQRQSEDQQLPRKPTQPKTKAQIFRAKEAAARKRAEKSWTVDNDGYNFQNAVAHYTNVDKYIKPKDMKFIVDHREKQLCDELGKVMRTVVRGAIHPLIDNVVTGFCQRLGMSETHKVPTVEERMFLWFSRERALKLMNRMGPKQQVYFLNYIVWDNVLTDLQAMNSRLRHCSLCEGQSFGEHYCHDPEKVKEVFYSRFNVKPETPLPKMLFVDKQTICSHVYSSQEFNAACEEKDCPNFGKRMCRCFQLNIFIPETQVLATKTQFERVLKKFIEDKYFNQRWLIRASNLKNGNGIQFIDSAAELETFLRYDIRRRLRGQFFIMQRYIKNPMLMNLRRFDCRMYLMVCVLSDRRVLGFLHPGYVREAQKEYDPASNDLRCHLTLPFTWDPDYNRYKVEKPEDLPDYCHPYSKVCESLELPMFDYVTIDDELRAGNHFISKLNCIVHEIVRSMESIIFDKPGTWQLFGLDMAVDNDKNPWLCDIMTYPGVAEPDFFSETQNTMLPAILTEALAIVFELNQRDYHTRSRLEWMDMPDIPWNKPGLITAQQNFAWLYSTSPDRLLSYKEECKIPRVHWYHQWRITEDFNDYILYLKNFRVDSIVRQPETNIYGRKTFDNSPVFKLKQQLKKAGVKPQ